MICRDMKSLLEALQQKVERLDTAYLNRVRVVTILVFALGCGIVLRAQLFNTSKPLSAGQFVASTLPVRVVSQDEAVSVQPTQIIEQAGGDVQEPELVRPTPTTTTKTEPIARPVPLSLTARAVIATKGAGLQTIRYQNNADARLPIASLTKLMTATVVIEQGMLGDTLTVSKTAVGTEGAAGKLVVGEKLIVADALRIMLIVSSNDAAVALQEYFTERGIDLVAEMNKKAQKLGMANTHFANPSGLDGEGHYSSARDMAALTAYSLQHQLLWEILSYKSATVRSIDGAFTHQLTSNNELVQSDVKGVRAGKTGYTEKALGCMISVLEDGSVIVLLGSQDRGGETEKLITAFSHD